jgi:hypothetical protein
MVRRPAIVLFIVAIAALAASADDFWVKKDWSAWSENDCVFMLGQSPWAKTTRVMEQNTDPKFTPGSNIFIVQLFSAEPIRQAFVRQLQIRQHYDKMTEAQKKEFDGQAEHIINHKYDDSIIFRIDYSGTPRESQEFLGQIHPDASNCENTWLITDKGEKILPIKFVNNRHAQMYDLSFPRVVSGQPVIADSAKSFTLQFERLTSDYQAGAVRVFFYPNEMKWKGSLTY